MLYYIIYVYGYIHTNIQLHSGIGPHIYISISKHTQTHTAYNNSSIDIEY